MPTTYTHYSFGQEVLKGLNAEKQSIIEKYKELFDVGLHGPDLLFYYNALSKNEVNRLGSALHKLPGSFFFENAVKVIGKQEEKEAYYAYVYGFICHYVLDVFCHGYIDEKIVASGITHAEIEAELDRELLVMAGKNPVKQKLTGHINPSFKSAEVIQSFFDNIDEKQIYKCMKDMVLYLNVLVAPSKLKRGCIFKALKLAGCYEGMHGLIINYEKNPECADSTAKLLALYDEAVEMAVELIAEFHTYVENKEPLSDFYRYNFSSVIPKDVVDGEADGDEKMDE